MDVLSLARFQFGMTTVFHFFFVPLSIGLGFAIAIMQTLYVVKKDEMYKDMTKFWSKLFLLGFAVGVVTGIIQEFQFGMNWSEYSRFMGDIFGAPLAVEALLAFFLESTFIGLWMFGWDKFNKKLHLLCIWLVAIGSMLSALWILAANSFMQNPVAYHINEATNRAELTSFVGLLKNPQLWLQFPHVIFGTIVTGGFVIAGSSAWMMMKKKNKEELPFFRRSLKFGLVMGLVGSILTIGAGHQQMIYVAKDQPMKFAAMEGIYEDTTAPAPWSLISGIDTKEKKTDWSIEVPYLLTLLGGEQQYIGMDEANKQLHEQHDAQFGEDMDYFVPVKTLFWGFRFMAGFGTLLALMAVIGLYLLKNNRILKMKWFLLLLTVGITFPFISNTFGWLITELGRAPWTVYGLFTIADSVSPSVTWGNLLFSNIIYFSLFLVLGFVMVAMAKREIAKGPYYVDESEAKKDGIDPFAKEVF
ncbi:cytochrome ubiquinol oxidase subunit I [Vagococcus penaei]|uniref:Cytochrome ubiquinol oxidase subunit I n=1 Tax=Vagococcus penaei TaxID=633807 RepID=A0A1Q2D5M8_9ENTE|nr:cytochrome ubiquinol oxidase subunit I [Vagococcus penaei]AQP53700.1 cytochrome ubiquinol oxidase subunit I [Vagococcus penaei]RST99449.1 cytochrome ubiquinol oxidase subunit I [Vagococcus penaei]